MTTLEQPKTIGILGGGQLGLMLSESLANLGARVIVVDPSKDSPAARRTAFTRIASFEDEDALSRLFQECDRVTWEFEHIPTRVLRRVLDATKTHNKLWPSVSVLENSQNRIAEKKALAKAHAPLTHWVEIQNFNDLLSQKDIWINERREAILKTANGGYDGKGQWRLSTPEQWTGVVSELGASPQAFPMVLEEKCDLLMELSVIVGRHPTLGSVVFPAVENKHSNGILDTTYFPARLPFEICEDARRIAERIADAWDVFGLLTVEFFAVKSASGVRLLVNEVAPRPHNSGHITRRSLTRSQFDILAQILLDLPCEFQQIAPEETWAMWNTLGDLWHTGAPTWPSEVIGHKAVCEAMLYGKPEVRPGRKMGHVILRSSTHHEIDKEIEFFRTAFSSKKAGHL
ncbi:MAG: ATP-grasp domain-containing protein [Silvanigrellaceae bacterium]